MVQEFEDFHLSRLYQVHLLLEGQQVDGVAALDALQHRAQRAWEQQQQLELNRPWIAEVSTCCAASRVCLRCTAEGPHAVNLGMSSDCS